MRITFHAQFVLKPVCAGMLRSQYRRKFKQMRLLNEIVQLRLLFRRQSGGVDVMDQSQSRKSSAPLQVNLHICFSKAKGTNILCVCTRVRSMKKGPALVRSCGFE